MNELIEKYQLSDHVFSHPMDAQSKSNAMGLGGAIHVYDVDGQAYYMPGGTHEEYLRSMEIEEVPEQNTMVEALRAVVREIMSKKETPDFRVLKVDEEQRIIYGWASVTKMDDEWLIDRQGDIIHTETLHKAVNDFMKDVRVGKVMHQGEQVGQIVHSFPVSKEIMGALGIQTNKEGWIVGYHVQKDDLWEQVKSGVYAAFSIGGAAVKEESNA